MPPILLLSIPVTDLAEAGAFQLDAPTIASPGR